LLRNHDVDSSDQLELNRRRLVATALNEKKSNRDACGSGLTSSIMLLSVESSRDRRIRSAMVRAHEQIKINKIKKTEMLQKARAALPLTKLRERAFEGAFFSVALIAMAGWVYFITLLLVRLFLWFFG
jgi:hypothetical protein